MEDNELGKMIKNYRQSKQMSMQEFADAIAVPGGYKTLSRQAVYHWEHGEWNPSQFALVRIAIETNDWRRDFALDCLSLMDEVMHKRVTTMLVNQIK